MKATTVPVRIDPAIAHLRVPIDSVKPFPGNPRRGDLEALKESLRANGQFRPIVVSADDVVLCGNHTRDAMLAFGAKEIAATRVGVRHDSAEARRIVAADNRLAQLGGMDDALLTELLRSLPEPTVGTGFDQGAIDALLSASALPEFEASEEEQGRLDHLRAVQCPHCGERFELPA